MLGSMKFKLVGTLEMNERATYLRSLLDNSNVKAFLCLIREGESSQEEQAYQWLFGSTRRAPKLFDSFADHPRVRTYERYDGQFIKNGKIDYTTAAGAYQITETTWGGCVRALDLPDFSPASQDLAALYLIWQRKALDDVLAGRIQEAIIKLRLEWASLPGSTYGQPTVALEKALEVYRVAGGVMRPAGTPAPVVDLSRKAEPMSPLILPLATTLIDIFSPLAKEKITKELNRHTDKPEVAAQIANGVLEAAKSVTGMSDPVEAAAAVKKDPDLMANVERMSLADLDKLVPALEKLNAMEQANIKSAREYNAAEPMFLDFGWLKLKFVHLLSLVFVGFAGWFAARYWPDLTPELKGAVMTLMIIAGWNGVRDYWMGSSSGSERKTEMLTKRGD